MGALYGALQRGRWWGECGCGLLRGPGAAHGARVQAGARDGGVGGCLGGTEGQVVRLALPLPRYVTLLGGHFGNSKFYRLRNHGTSDGRTLTTPRPVERRVALATSQGPAVAVRAVHNGSSYSVWIMVPGRYCKVLLCPARTRNRSIDSYRQTT
jgi:hypothetical protein